MRDFRKPISLDEWQELSRDEQCAYKAKFRPRNDEELKIYLRDVWGVSLPDCAHPDCLNKKRPCTAPFKVFSDCYFCRYPMVILQGSRGSGKAQTLSSPVLTPQGWSTMGQLLPGSSVVDMTGNVVKVTHIHPQGTKQTYKVSFNDGTSTLCCGDHLWTVRATGKSKKRNADGSKKDRDWVVKTTEELKNNLYVGKARKDLKWRIPIVEPVKFPEAELSIDPYSLGLILGDGSIVQGSPSFTSGDPELVTALAKGLKELGVNPKPVASSSYGYGLTKIKSGKKPNPLKTELEKLGLQGTNSYTKFVPKDYLFSSTEQRLAILQGLLDTDGSAGSVAGVDYVTASKQLCDDVVFLVQSLGGTAVRNIKHIEGYSNPYYRLYIKMPVCPFRLSRKVAKWVKPSQYPVTRIITSIEEHSVEECQCITVDSPTSTYLTNDCIVTHNSVLCALLALVEQVTLDANILVLGASETQSKVVFNYQSQKNPRLQGQFWDSPNAPLLLKDESKELSYRSVIVTGGTITALPASPTSVYGQRPSRLRIDEVDLADIELIDGAFPCVQPFKHKTDPNLSYGSNILLSSTSYSADGTLVELIKRANKVNNASLEEGGDIVIPVYSFCYKDVLEENGGYISAAALKQMKSVVTSDVWERQYENGEPAVEGCVFNDDDLKFLIDDSLTDENGNSDFKGDNHEKIRIHEKHWGKGHYQYYTGADFGDKVDWTVISTFSVNDNPELPDVMVAWERHGRCGLKRCAAEYDAHLEEFETSAAHDATGGSQFVGEELTHHSESVSWTKKFKHEALNNFIAAVEQHKLKIPKIEFLEKDLKFLTYEQCFGNEHLPDSVASLIMAYYSRRKIVRNINIGGIKF